MRRRQRRNDGTGAAGCIVDRDAARQLDQHAALDQIRDVPLDRRIGGVERAGGGADRDGPLQPLRPTDRIAIAPIVGAATEHQ